ncbi:MAG: hypothetical protein VE98_C0001G0019 [candidate division Kazan bacterium GW2011_GWA1_50_15]|uniref:Replication-associated protein G2P N-terminal domain-containing protein n=2 Tax=Bacteria division Kazan-3B-28 TaxID=1798534 RepID=A0A0G1X756_UNCK3|nr:MAG: hypothetical protein VE98_C0001G0019 [candidate division Kazan bacterium GW2011_GWA1_50_15]KKW25698.1 MAG: hypothetical protein VE99_C0001G0337 [candidate division Kazan bacterium GW2011_GWC1_52_13]KKW27003.1 MAG: hypothetical protein VF00_C0002G0330 [candidate division Kazan bacterium GW2011_GWB1_52_7]HCR42579.1 hypothetical protein [Patescibacteria group bacterium]
MIDTIVLKIPKGQYYISKPDKFSKNADDFTKYEKPISKITNNPTAEERRLHHYRPCLTLTKRWTKDGQIAQELTIQFSAPKLLYGNNLEELTDSDFDAVLERLTNSLRDIGVNILKPLLATAQVSAVHYSKNIELEDGYTPSFVIKELMKVNISKKLDITRHGFQNDGQSLQYYATSNSLVFYDKIQDIQKTKNRSIDKDQNYIQRSLFEQAQEQKLEILRVEIRIADRRKLNSLLQKLGYPKNPTFKDVFCSGTSQKVVSYYWQELIANHNLFIFTSDIKPKQILNTILINHPKIKHKQAIFLTGLYLLAKDATGIRELRQMLNNRANPRTWTRIVKELKNLNKSPAQYDGWVKQVIAQIDEFQPYKPRFEM